MDYGGGGGDYSAVFRLQGGIDDHSWDGEGEGAAVAGDVPSPVAAPDLDVFAVAVDSGK